MQSTCAGSTKHIGLNQRRTVCVQGMAGLGDYFSLSLIPHPCHSMVLGSGACALAQAVPDCGLADAARADPALRRVLVRHRAQHQPAARRHLPPAPKLVNQPLLPCVR